MISRLRIVAFVFSLAIAPLKAETTAYGSVTTHGDWGIFNFTAGLVHKIPVSLNAKNVCIGAAIFLLPLEIRFAQWLLFKLQTHGSVVANAQELATFYEKRYGKAIQANGKYIKSIEQIVHDCHNAYKTEEHGLIELCRKANWLSMYYKKVDYPFIHTADRLEEAIRTLYAYENALTDECVYVKQRIHILIQDLSDLLTQITRTPQYQHEHALIRQSPCYRCILPLL